MIFKISLLFIPLISPWGLFYKIANFYCFKKFLCLCFIYVQIQVCTDGGKREIWGSHFSPSTMWVLQNGLRSLGLAAGNSIHKTISKGLQFSILNLGFLNYQVSNLRLVLNIRRYMFIQFWRNTENRTFFEVGSEVVQAEPDSGSSHNHSPLQCWPFCMDLYSWQIGTFTGEF